MDKTMRQDVLDTMNEINSLRDENERITRLLKGWITWYESGNGHGGCSVGILEIETKNALLRGEGEK